MIALLMRLGLSQRTAKTALFIIVPILILVLFYLSLDAYGDSRFREGRATGEAAWKAANDRLLKQAAQSADEADRVALAKAIDQAIKVEEEKERIDDAIANGSSPFDVLFPAGGVPAR